MLFVVLGAVFNLVFIPLAIPFGIAAYFIWQDATGQLADRIRYTYRHQAAHTKSAGPRGGRGRADSRHVGTDVEWARRVLSVEAESDQETLREAYRERAKDVHPDTDGGDEAAFKQVTQAYELLREHTNE